MVSSYRLGMVTFLPVRTDSSGRAKEKGLAPAAMSGKINITPISILNLNQNKKEESLSFEGQKKQKHLPEFQKNIL